MSDDDLKLSAAKVLAGWAAKSPSLVRRTRRESGTKSKPARHLVCPGWVSLNFKNEWLKVARDKDEYAAAAHVRHLMMEHRR